MVVFTGDNKSAEILIKAGVAVNALGGDYGTILQAVAFTGDNKSTEILIKAGTNVNAQGVEHGNALQMMASCGQKKLENSHKSGRRYKRSGWILWPE